MNQKLVTKKNKKVRLLRELYPEIDARSSTSATICNLLVKYGLEEPQTRICRRSNPDPGPASSRRPGVGADDATAG